jgi:hypothetical protein
MSISSHEGWEQSGSGKLGDSHDEGLILPSSHTEGLAYAEDHGLGSVARDVFSNEELFGAGLQREWNSIVGHDAPEEVFRVSYEAYVTDPATLYREAPEQYRFLKEHVFYGLEYFDERTFFLEQISDGIEALESMEALRPEVWEALSVQEQAEVLQEVEARLAERAGRPAVPVVVEQIERDKYGYFDGTAIHVNVSHLSDLAETIDTVAHEGRHAYQHHAVEHSEFHPYADQILAWKKNFEKYVDGRFDPEGYRKQPVEADAWAFGRAIRDGLRLGRRT